MSCLSPGEGVGLWVSGFGVPGLSPGLISEKREHRHLAVTPSPPCLSAFPDAPFPAAAPGLRIHAGRRREHKGGGIQLGTPAALLHPPVPPVWGQSCPRPALAQDPHQSQVGTPWRLGLEGRAQGLLWAETGPDWDLQWFGVLGLQGPGGERAGGEGSANVRGDLRA